MSASPKWPEDNRVKDVERLVVIFGSISIFLFIVYIMMPNILAILFCSSHTIWAVTNTSAACMIFGYSFAFLAVSNIYVHFARKLVSDESPGLVSSPGLSFRTALAVTLLLFASCLLWAWSAGSYACVKTTGIEIHRNMFLTVKKNEWDRVSFVQAECGMSARGGIPWSRLNLFIKGEVTPLPLLMNYSDVQSMSLELAFLKTTLAPFPVKYAFSAEADLKNCPIPFLRAIKALPF